MLVILSAVAVGSIYALLLFMQVSRSLPSIADIGNFRPAESTRIYYADGKEMAVLATENRRPVKLEEVSKSLIDATIAVEDHRFYEHQGLDYYGILRALYRNITGGDLTGQGGSTLTQQLARNITALGLTKEKRFRRKIAEAMIAVRIEQVYSKNEILELYLNQVYYGNGAYGVEAASRAYFHKSSKKLTVGEAALLAGLPQRPSLYAVNREAAMHRRDAVLQRMVETGKITPAQRDAAMKEKIAFYRAQPNATRIYGAPYFVNYVVGPLVNTYGYDAVYSGWRIYTTLDSRMQKEAEEALRRGVRNADYANQGCLISLDPKTGYIRAMVGGVDFKRDQFNAVSQGRRQPGSAFKPIVYTAAMDTGVCDLNSTYVDDPNLPGRPRVRTAGYAQGRNRDELWRPKNYSGKYSYAPVTILSAIRNSLNTVAVKVAMDTGLGTVIDYAKRMGITTELAPYPPLALGASAVRPLDLACAYGVFANNGKRVIPLGVVRILAPNGDIIEENTPQVVDVQLRTETLAMMNQALREVVTHGTGTRANLVPEARGKTGTTSNNIDAWFAGYTPDLVTVIWVAREQRNKKGAIVRYAQMPGTTGGEVCAPIWRDYMLKAIPIQQSYNQSANPAPAKSTDPQEQPKPDPNAPKPPPAQPPVQPPDSLENPVQDGGDVTAPGSTIPGQPSQPPTPSVPMPNPGAPQLAPGGGGQPETQPSVTPPSGGGAGLSAPSPTLSSPGSSPTLSGGGASSRTSDRDTLSTRRIPDAPAMREPRLTEPGTRLEPPPARRASEDDIVTVSLCADSMRAANSYCPVTIERRIRRKEIPRRCTIHKEGR